jgi:hypothetical protein
MGLIWQESRLIRTRLGARGAYWHRVRIGAITLASANTLRGAGASCLVQRSCGRAGCSQFRASER